MCAWGGARCAEKRIDIRYECARRVSTDVNTRFPVKKRRVEYMYISGEGRCRPGFHSPLAPTQRRPHRQLSEKIRAHRATRAHSRRIIQNMCVSYANARVCKGVTRTKKNAATVWGTPGHRRWPTAYKERRALGDEYARSRDNKWGQKSSFTPNT